MARAVECGLGVRNTLARIDEFLRLRLRIKRGIGKQRLAQGLETCLLGDLRLGAPLGLEGRIDVFQFHLGGSARDGTRQFRRELALFVDALEDSGATILQLSAGSPSRSSSLRRLRVVQTARLLLAVARDEGNGCPLAHQLHAAATWFTPTVQLAAICWLMRPSSSSENARDFAPAAVAAEAELHFRFSRRAGS